MQKSVKPLKNFNVGRFESARCQKRGGRTTRPSQSGSSAAPPLDSFRAVSQGSTSPKPGYRSHRLITLCCLSVPLKLQARDTYWARDITSEWHDNNSAPPLAVVMSTLCVPKHSAQPQTTPVIACPSKASLNRQIVFC